MENKQAPIWKTTLIGLLMIVTSTYLLVYNISHDYYINAALYGLGLLLLFSSDRLLDEGVDIIINYFKKKVDKE
jgi:hypothetical protein